MQWYCKCGSEAEYNNVGEKLCEECWCKRKEIPMGKKAKTKGPAKVKNVKKFILEIKGNPKK